MSSQIYFITGFPGFIATRVVKRLIQQAPSARFELLVHPSQVQKAKEQIAALCKADFGQAEQYTIIAGDITLENLGMDETTRARLQDSVEIVFHLAAIYDLAVSKELAYRVNVTGTGNVNQWVLSLKNLTRYVYFSTAYVSGGRTGRILETELTCGQTFKNFYESTKFEAEVLVQNIRDQVPLTIIRPGIVVGDSVTGETVKFDGPYFMMRFLDKCAALAVPYIGQGGAPFNVVPVDYVVNAACYLSHQQVGLNKVYHLTDPRPRKVSEVFRMFSESLHGKTPSFTLSLPLVARFLSITPVRRWVGVTKESLEYFDLTAEHDNTEAVADLQGSGVSCPEIIDYIKSLTGFYAEHRHDLEKMIKVK